MSLMKRGDVWWSYFTIDGVRHQNSTGTSNRKQADAIEQKLKAEANARRHQLVEVDPKLTFGAVAARFLTSSSLRPHHIHRLKQLLPYFADTPAIRVSKGMTRDYRVYRQSLGPITDATVNRDLSVLRHILYWAVDESLLLTNPLTRLPLARERRTRRPVLSLEEEVELLASAPEHLAKVTVAALDTGMRRGEILNQQWEHIDLPRHVLAVSHSKTPEGEAREIPLTARLEKLLVPMHQRDGPVFTYHGAPIASIKTSWRNALQDSGIRKFRFHDLRHTFNTRLMEAGVLQEIRMALMGHSNPERVHSMYTHVELPTKRAAIARLEAWVNQQQQQSNKEYDNAST